MKRVGILAGGPSSQPNADYMRTCEAVVCMNQSVKWWPHPDMYCVADPDFIAANRELIDPLALTHCQIVQGIVTNMGGYATRVLDIADTVIHYGYEDRLFHGRTVGVLAIRCAIMLLGATHLVIAGVDGYTEAERGIAARPINEAQAKALRMIRDMHPSVTWEWRGGTLIEELMDAH